MIDQFRALSELPENETKNANISFLPPSNTSPLKFEGRNCTSSSMVTSFLRGLLPSLIYCKVHKFPTQQTPLALLKQKMQKHLFSTQWKVPFAHNAPLGSFHPKSSDFFSQNSESIITMVQWRELGQLNSRDFWTLQKSLFSFIHTIKYFMSMFLRSRHFLKNIWRLHFLPSV